MHLIKNIKLNRELFDESMKKRGVDIDSDFLITLDSQVNTIKNKLEFLYSEQNRVANSIADLKRAGKIEQNPKEFSELIKRGEELKGEIPDCKKDLQILEDKLKGYLVTLPNFLSKDVPLGKDDDDNHEIRHFGKHRDFTFIPQDHVVIGENLEQMDFKGAVKMSGSRFVVLKNKLAALERALHNFMLDLHTQTFSFTEMSVPTLVLNDAMFNACQLPKFDLESFAVSDKYRLIPTSEVSLVNMVSDTVLEKNQLPLRFVAFTRCYRSEAGAAGRDTKGMIRMHEFPKVELVSITTPDQSEQEHEYLLKAAEKVLQLLELPYRVVLLCSGSIGFHSVKTYDIEVWLPGQIKADGGRGMYREIVSCSNCWSLQSHRLNSKYVKDVVDGKKRYEYLHTLNCSGIAVGRALIAILENYQQEDGSVVVPEVLRKYTGFDLIK